MAIQAVMWFRDVSLVSRAASKYSVQSLRCGSSYPSHLRMQGYEYFTKIRHHHYNFLHPARPLAMELTPIKIPGKRKARPNEDDKSTRKLAVSFYFRGRRNLPKVATEEISRTAT
jgi:hypothetical protein